MSRVTELESEIGRLTRSAPTEALQRRIDGLTAELIAWQLSGARMHAADDAIRAAARRCHRAHTGRRRWPVVAGASGLLGTVATAGHLAADGAGPPLIGGVFLATAAIALGLTAVDRARDARALAAATTDMHTAQARYAALVDRHTPAIASQPPATTQEAS
ncbi:hypothetical protein [Salinispora pacifica]|uniref:hypothetical protein n=1 Tax=Salinispora pacifica TaxID=351187 RepID=UPI0003763C5F|nr:hypothetical protein [Salinispora pacifica]